MKAGCFASMLKFARNKAKINNLLVDVEQLSAHRSGFTTKQ